MNKIVLLCAIACVTGLAAACEPPKTEPPVKNAAPANNANQASSNLDRELLSDDVGPDNSRIRVKQLDNGAKVTIRSWKEGPIRKLKKRENAGQVKAIRFTMRDGKELVVEDPVVIEHALDWSAAQLTEAAKKSGTAAGARGKGEKPPTKTNPPATNNPPPRPGR